MVATGYFPAPSKNSCRLSRAVTVACIRSCSLLSGVPATAIKVPAVLHEPSRVGRTAGYGQLGGSDEAGDGKRFGGLPWGVSKTKLAAITTAPITETLMTCGLIRMDCSTRGMSEAGLGVFRENRTPRVTSQPNSIALASDEPSPSSTCQEGGKRLLAWASRSWHLLD